MSAKPPIRTAGTNAVRLWGLTSEQRLRRIARAQSFPEADMSDASTIVAALSHVWDPAWLRLVGDRPGVVLTRNGLPVLGHARSAEESAGLATAIEQGAPLPASLEPVAQEQAEALVNDELRKRERPFMEALTPETVPALERASYFGAYKGVTDLLTKYLWPEWALVLTRLCARAGITPNQVTIVGVLLCVLATVAFWHGWYWSGMAVGLAFMVLDTVDGKLARCTITSSRIGDILDHGVDLVHPPFWWWAWGVGLAAYGLPLSDAVFGGCMAAILIGYVVQRLIEGAFIARFGMHIHVWRPFDSWFRLITARRNPNMVILFASVVLMRPDCGLVGVAVWTVLSLLVHAVQLVQAIMLAARGERVRSWLG